MSRERRYVAIKSNDKKFRRGYIFVVTSEAEIEAIKEFFPKAEIQVNPCESREDRLAAIAFSGCLRIQGFDVKSILREIA